MTVGSLRTVLPRTTETRPATEASMSNDIALPGKTNFGFPYIVQSHVNGKHSHLPSVHDWDKSFQKKHKNCWVILVAKTFCEIWRDYKPKRHRQPWSRYVYNRRLRFEGCLTRVCSNTHRLRLVRSLCLKSGWYVWTRLGRGDRIARSVRLNDDRYVCVGLRVRSLRNLRLKRNSGIVL